MIWKPMIQVFFPDISSKSARTVIELSTHILKSISMSKIDRPEFCVHSWNNTEGVGSTHPNHLDLERGKSGSLKKIRVIVARRSQMDAR